MAIQITVSGCAAEGKTAIASAIAFFLENKGFNVELSDDNGTGVPESEPLTEFGANSFISHLANKKQPPLIKINTRMTMRTASYDQLAKAIT